MKTHARVVIVGGGMMGVGLLYHLAKEGWSDVVLCEKGELTSGSTWHAAALTPHFIGSLNMAKVHSYGIGLYKTLEEESGQATGWHGCGSLRLATNREEVDWFHLVQGVVRLAGAELHIVSPAEIPDLHPLLNTAGVLAGAWTPGDGHSDPNGTCNAMAIVARRHGAEIYRHTRVTAIEENRGEWRVLTDKGAINCEHVVNAAGCYGPQVGAMVGLKVPIVNMVHQYVMTENVDEVAALAKEIPVVRDPRASCYSRQEQKGLIFGPYETEGSRVCFPDGVDWGFDMELLEPELERIAKWLEMGMERIPCSQNAGIKKIISGPITHTPDGTFLLGPAAGLRNFWMCCGAAIGITQGAGAGKYLAQWMMHGQTEINVREFDPRRFGDYAAGEYNLAKSLDDYEHMYQVHFPGEFRDPGRPVKVTPVYEKLKSQGAVFAEVFGWERPKWFATEGERGEKYSFRRTNWFAPVAAECRAVRERAGVCDLSGFTKLEVCGEDAEGFLNRLCCNRMPAKDGGIILGHMLTERGGIECEMTITRIAAGRYYVLSAIVAQIHDHDWLSQHVRDGERVSVTDVTDETAMLALAGPRARDILGKLTDADLGNAAFPWLSARQITVAGVAVRALRVSYVGELGWELHHPMSDMEKLYDALMDAGRECGVANFGVYAVNSMRLEKAYKAWGAELTTEIVPAEAGIERFVRYDKDFIGKAAALAQKESGLRMRIVYLTVSDGDNDALGNEPLFQKGGDDIIGVTTSGAFGHSVGRSIAFGYVKPALAAAGTKLEIAMLGERREAVVTGRAVYDPDNAKLRA